MSQIEPRLSQNLLVVRVCICYLICMWSTSLLRDITAFPTIKNCLPGLLGIKKLKALVDVLFRDRQGMMISYLHVERFTYS